MRTRVAFAAAVALLSTAAAIAQQDDAPESLLPPGFGEPAPPPPSSPSGPTVQPLPSQQATSTSAPLPGPAPSPFPTPSPTPIDPAELARYEMPPFARRSLAQTGVVGPREGGVRANAFGSADGRYLETLMRRLAAPLPSRWLSIGLRRALTSRLDTPARINGADFAAERAWLLLRMGEAVAARSVVQAVDNDNATPKWRQIAMQSELATGDPGGLCPLVDAALAAPSPEGGWTMAQAMCAALAAEPQESRALVRQLRRRRGSSGVDFQLVQKVAGLGADSQQAVTIEWDGVQQLTTWRYGLAVATGVEIPDRLYATVGPQVYGWRALAPMIPVSQRAAIAGRAATMGVLSNSAMVDLFSALDANEEIPPALAAIGSDLQTAYVGATAAARRDALTQLWSVDTPRERYGRLILTARAAARIPVPSSDTADGVDVGAYVAAMLAAGLDRSAQRWSRLAGEGTDAWAMLQLSDPDARGQADYSVLSAYSPDGDAADHKQRLFFAGMAGLGRVSRDDIERGAKSLDVPIGASNVWTRALDRAVAQDQPATVLLLTAIGMQTPDWRGVPPAMLYRSLAALRAVGLGGYARMIAAEAIART